MAVYIVFWFYKANHGWEMVDAESPSHALEKSIYSFRKDIFKVATPLATLRWMHGDSSLTRNKLS